MTLRFPIAPQDPPADARPADAACAGSRPDTLRFERRRNARTACSGTAIVTDLSGEHWGERHDVDLVDLGAGGLGAISDRPMPPGTAVSVVMRDKLHGFRRGVVVRCLPCGHGYRLGLAFEQRMAA